MARAELPPAAPLESRGRASAGCFTGTSPELVVQSERGLVLYGGEPTRLRKLSSIDLASLVFAGPLDIDGDLRHELVAVTEKRTGDSVTVRAHVLRVEGGKLTMIGDEDVYRVTATTVGWFGAKLSNVDLVLWADARPGAVEVRGLYVDRVGGRQRHVVPLVPRTIPVRPRKKPEGSGPAVEPGSTRSIPGGGSSAGAVPGAKSHSGAEPGSSSLAPDPKSADTERPD
jgi:hypothetical protein